MDRSVNERPVPGAPDTTENTVDGQRALRLHAGIAIVAVVLCAFVAAVFLKLGVLVLAVAFAVIAVGCLAILGWAVRRKRRGQRASRRR